MSDVKSYVSPSGSAIVGTLEHLSGRAEIIGIDENGVPEFAGETEIFWDDAKTVTRDNKIIFLDEDGSEWTFDQLTPDEDDDDAPIEDVPDFDNTQAEREGWGIFESHSSENGPYQLQRDDGSEIFATDAAAWEFIVWQARGGSAYHRSALAYLKEHNPPEWDAINFYCPIEDITP